MSLINKRERRSREERGARERGARYEDEFVYEYNKKHKSNDTDDTNDVPIKKVPVKDETAAELANKVYTKDNRIYFRSDVTADSVDQLIKLINDKNDAYREIEKNKLIESFTPKAIYLHITSFGGSLIACFRAVDCIINSKIPIYTVVDGHAASAGTLMSVVGKKRFMMAHSYMMIHQLSAVTFGKSKYWEIKDDFTNCELIMDDIYRIYEEHTGMNRKQLEEYLSHDIWWKVDKCIEVGLVDEVYKYQP